MEQHKDSEFYRRVLNRAHCGIVSDLEPHGILDAFIEEDFLAASQIRDILELQTTSMKNRIILSKVSQSGVKGYILFKKCLQKSRQQYLVEYLEHIENNFAGETNKDKHTQDKSSKDLDRKPTDQELASVSQASGHGWEQVYYNLMTWKQSNAEFDAVTLELFKELNNNTSVTVDWDHIKNKFGIDHSTSYESLQTTTRTDNSSPQSPPATNLAEMEAGVNQMNLDSDVSHEINEPREMDDTDGRSTAIRNLTDNTTSEQEGEPVQETNTNNTTNQGPTVESTLGDVFSESGLHDGRLIILEPKHVQELKENNIEKTVSGGYGKVHILKDKIPGLDIRVVLKEIKLGTVGDVSKIRSVTCEKLSSRIMHFGIVPLLAICEDSTQREYYFVSPYMEGGNLREAIEEDTKLCNETGGIDKVKLNFKVRVKILYQIASAINYLHTPVPKLRGVVIHTDIKSANIVLDGGNNARLTDFGLASSLLGTFGYIQTATTEDRLTMHADQYNFGVVMREMLTGESPEKLIGCPEGKQFRLQQFNEKNDNMKTLRNCVNDNEIWKEPDALDARGKILNISTRCIESKRTKDKTFSGEMKEEIESVLLSIADCRKFHRVNESKCDICMVNRTVKRMMADKHPSDCRSPIEVCVVCMRNSYLNPIECHSCGNTIQTPVGDGWGALLVAGNDCSNHDLAKSFTNDVKTFGGVLKTLPVMCLNPSNVEIVCPDVPGMEEANWEEKLDQAILNLNENGNALNTVVFMFSGHNTTANGFRLGTIEHCLTQGVLEEKLKKLAAKKFIVFLDCSEAQTFHSLSKDTKLVQLNACGYKEQAIVDAKHVSLFTRFLIQAFTREALRKKCSNNKLSEHDGNKYECKGCVISGDFIKIETLVKYITYHTNEFLRLSSIKSIKVTPRYSVTDADDCTGTIVAYKCDFEVEMRFSFYDGNGAKFTFQVKPDDYMDIASLKSYLFHKYLDAIDLRDDNVWGESVIGEYSKVLRIEIDTGPNPDQTEQLDSIERLNAAWNAKRELKITHRSLKQIKEGRAAVTNLKEGDAQLLFDCLKAECSCPQPNVKCSISEQMAEISLTSGELMKIVAEHLKEKCQSERGEHLHSELSALDDVIEEDCQEDISILFRSDDGISVRGDFVCFQLQARDV